MRQQIGTLLVWLAGIAFVLWIIWFPVLGHWT